jgi:hypothetical protein
MSILCLDASLEPHWSLCRCLHIGSPQVLQAVVMLLACHVLQKIPQFIVQGFEVCTPQKQIIDTDEGQKVPLQPPLSCLGLLGKELSPAGRSIPNYWRGSCWAVSRLLVARPLDTFGHQFHSFQAKMKMCHPLMGHLPPSHDGGRVMASLHPQNAPQGAFEHKSYVWLTVNRNSVWIRKTN